MVCYAVCECQRFVGLVNGSIKAAYNGSHIMCSYSRLIAIDQHRAGTDRVMNLSEPRYILLARGPTNEKGSKQFDPSFSVLFVFNVAYLHGHRLFCSLLLTQ